MRQHQKNTYQGYKSNKVVEFVKKIVENLLK